MSKKLNQAITKINEQGILLVFPIKNQTEPKSLWSEFYPKSKMSWEWNEDGDDRVMQMWFLMKKLSNCGDVVYTKWYKGRATLFSKDVFVNLLAYTKELRNQKTLSKTSNEILELLQYDSPLSTKVIKRETGLIGRDFNSEYERAMRLLFQKLYILSYGEVNDGAFPSSAIGATSLLFEDLWIKANDISVEKSKLVIDHFLPINSEFRKFLNSLMKK